MKKNVYVRHVWLFLLMAVLALTAGCGAAPASQPPAAVPPPTEAATEEKVTPTEETPTEEAATTPAETPDASLEELADLQESEGVQAKSLEGGLEVISQEDVSTPRTHYGGEYRDVDSSDAVSFHFYTTTDAPSHGYAGLVYTGGFTRYDEETLEIVPHMAERYVISEDGLTFTFYLRQDMKWSDGEPLTARDFEWTYQQASNPDNEFPYISQLDFIESYKALDDYTVEIKVKEVYAPALTQVDLVIPYPKHVWEQLDWTDPETNPEINHPSVVSGPYKLVEWKRDQHVIFEANENYWYKGRPNFDRYILEIVPDQDVAFQKLKSGETDTSSMTPEQLKEARTFDHVKVYEWWPAAATWFYVGLNMREGFVTHDINVRHGINYAINKEELTESIWEGLAKRLCSIYPETSWAYTPDVACYDYSPEQAIAEFAKSGYTFQDDIMLDKDGKQLTLRLFYGPHTSPTAELMALALQSDLAKVGVKVEIEAMDWASFVEATSSDDPQWDMYLGGWSTTIEPHISFVHWMEENIPDLNQVAYINKEVEQLFKEAGATFDIELRKEKYAKIQQIIAEESPYVFLYYRKSYSAQNNRIQGIDPKPLGIGWNQEDWFIGE
jgi:peptide/nickel transport system substrate-binding protein